MRKLLPLFLATGCIAIAQMDYLDNGVIRIGVDLGLGGSITWLSPVGGENMINSADLGRQIQQSYYSGPKPYGVAHPAWRDWAWNPIGTGDVYGNKSKVIANSNDGTTLHVRTIPMQWALNNRPCECTFDTWITLEANVVNVRARLNNQRTDRTQYGAFDQELPAVYTNGTYYRLYTYDGSEPFTGAAPRLVQNIGPPWASWTATENWAALINDAGLGLGVFNPGVYRFIGGFAGKPGVGGPLDSSTGYISPLHREVLDSNIRYSYEYRLIVGSLDQIRGYVYNNRPESKPDFRFRRDRQHWTFVNANDAGFPIRRHLRVLMDKNDPQMTGPPTYFRAEDVPKLYIRGAWHTKQVQAQIFWSTSGQRFTSQQSVTFSAVSGGEVRTYEVNMAESPEWKGWITGLRFDPLPSGAEGEYVDVYSISFRP